MCTMHIASCCIAHISDLIIELFNCDHMTNEKETAIKPI